MLSSRTKLVAVTHLSNVLGVCNPIAEIVKCAKRVGSVVFVDAAQSFCSMEIDVNELGCHFLVASGHKAYGPTGIGFLYVCKDIFNKIGVANVGGGTINKFYEGDVIYADFPYRLEPGTLPIASIIGLEASINYVKGIKISNIIDHKRSLTSLFLERMLKFNSVTVLNSEYNQSGIVSCYVNSYNVSDIALLLNAYMICSRAGFLCCHKLMDYLGINGAFRISFAVYNTVEEIDFFFDKFSRVLTKYIL
jgi:cysteine desulfurase/selenocysteine lyase